MTEEERETKDLELIDIEDEIESNLGRKVESLTAGQTNRAILMFILANIFILGVLIFGPSLIVMQPYQFDAPTDKSVRSKKITFEFSGFHVFHAFMAADLLFERKADQKIDPFDVSLNAFITTNIHSTKNDTTMPTRVEKISFDEGSTVSNRIRIYESTVVDFTDIHCWTALKYGISGDVLPSGRIEWFYGDPAHAIVQVFLRFVFFVMAILILIRLLMSDFNLKNSHISMRMMFFLDIFLMIGSNPFYILTFFTQSGSVKLFDSLCSNFLLQCCLFTAFAVLIMNGLKHRDVSLSWIMYRFIPFGVVFIILASGLIYYQSLINVNPLGIATDVSYFFVLAKALIGTIYIVSYAIAALAVFDSEYPNEKKAMVSLGVVFFTVIVICEVKTVRSGYVELQFANQIFELLAIGCYIMFFNYFNWPTDLGAAASDVVVPEIEGEALAQDLVADNVEQL